MSLASQLNLRPNYCELLQSVPEEYQKCLEGIKNNDRVPIMGYCLWSAACSGAMYSHLLGRWQECIDWGTKTANAAIFYLLGDWHETTINDETGQKGRDGWFGRFPASNWTMYLDEGLCWGAVAGCWERIDRMLTFPEPWIAEDYEGKALRGYYLGLARWWKDPTDVAWIDDVKQLRGAGSKGVHLLSDAILGISRRDAQTTAVALKKYVQWFLKRRDHEEQFPVQATFLWHVAQRKGLTLELPEDIQIYLFRLPDEG
jgi:hypothetical protein